MGSDIVVVGSLNMDIVVKVRRKPVWGETVLGSDLFMSPGGKGGNQAYAAGKLGASVAMIGCVGHDVFANAVGALTVTRPGAQVSMPAMNEAEQFIINATKQ